MHLPLTLERGGTLLSFPLLAKKKRKESIFKVTSEISSEVSQSFETAWSLYYGALPSLFQASMMYCIVFNSYLRSKNLKSSAGLCQVQRTPLHLSTR